MVQKDDGGFLHTTAHSTLWGAVGMCAHEQRFLQEMHKPSCAPFPFIFRITTTKSHLLYSIQVMHGLFHPLLWSQKKPRSLFIKTVSVQLSIWKKCSVSQKLDGHKEQLCWGFLNGTTNQQLSAKFLNILFYLFMSLKIGSSNNCSDLCFLSKMPSLQKEMSFFLHCSFWFWPRLFKQLLAPTLLFSFQ